MAAPTSVSSNVIRFTATGTYTGNAYIAAIKYIGSASGTAVMTDDASHTIWEQAGSTNFEDQGLHLKCPGGFTVTITNGASVYVYLK